MSIKDFNNKVVSCTNCGGYGHIHKNCNHPTTSYGIICFRFMNNRIEYCMVQRKDSLSYIEFLRGKYSLNQKQYIVKLIENMTIKERKLLLESDFDTLWKNLWQGDRNRNYQKEYSEAKYKFEILKAGYIIKNDKEVTFFSLNNVVQNTESILLEPEWGFPKGRRNINEDDFTCALREFKEETSLLPKNLYIVKHQPYEEVFSGSNNIRYRHIYYLAYLFNKNSYNQNKFYSKEIQDIQWFDYDDAQAKIRDHNIERKELFKRVNNNVIRMFCPYGKFNLKYNPQYLLYTNQII
jgi:ADP-ribose pyrophosphatase YjhB (NUDIX family)